MKKFAIVASAICLVALGAYAKNLFAPQASAYYIDPNSVCRELQAQTNTPFDAQGTATLAEIIDQNGTHHTLYTSSNCATGTEAKFVP